MEPVRITRIVVKGLFGTFDHDIPLNTEEGITLMIGENGMGKTVVLKTLKAVFEKDFSFVERIKFSKWEIHFSDEEVWEIGYENSPKKSEENKQFFIAQMRGLYKFDVARIMGRGFVFSGDRDLFVERVVGLMPDHFVIVKSANKDILIRDTYSEEVYEAFTFFKKYGKKIDRLIKKHKQKDDLMFPTWITNRVESLDIFLIETQRLRLSEEQKFLGDFSDGMIINFYADDLKSTISAKLTSYSELATSLDQSFPVRVARSVSSADTRKGDLNIRDGLEKLQQARQRLMKLGLYQGHDETLPYEDADMEVMRPMLSVYLEDNTKKIAVFNDLAPKISLFQKIINSRFLYKRMQISRENGFEFFSTLNESLIPLESLSSGEQHELVLFYQLLFKVEPNSLILIDEPEISLHVSWQNHFIDDLKEVINLNPLDLLIATHSPSIVGSHWDLAVQLRGVQTEIEA